MPTRTVFSDSDNNEMECYINTKGRLFIGIFEDRNEPMGSGFITLDKEDTKHLIEVLQNLLKDMED